MNKTGFYSHPDFVKHITGGGHPERPARIEAIDSRLKSSGLYSKLICSQADAVTADALLTVHPRDYITHIQNACKKDGHYLDSDTVVCHDSYQVALLAVGTVVEACASVMAGEINNAFCSVRPPGHHAEPNHAMGFCLFNNVAVAARWLQRKFNLHKICIVDWDVHHGNGTQAAFYSDPTVLYVSIHQHPLYPGTGLAEERGAGTAIGANLNLPVPPGLTDSDYIQRFDEVIAPAVRRFSPEFILISAGFDAHASDPLAQMRLTEDGFAVLTERIMMLAAESCHGRLVSVLEGGYDLTGLSASVQSHLNSLLADSRIETTK